MKDVQSINVPLSEDVSTCLYLGGHQMPCAGYLDKLSYFVQEYHGLEISTTELENIVECMIMMEEGKMEKYFDTGEEEE